MKEKGPLPNEISFGNDPFLRAGSPAALTRVFHIRSVFLIFAILLPESGSKIPFPEKKERIFLIGLADRDELVDADPEDLRQDDEVIHGRQRLAALPLVDGLRRRETENPLKVADAHSSRLPQTADVQARRGHVDDRVHIHFMYAPVPARGRTEPAQQALKL